MADLLAASLTAEQWDKIGSILTVHLQQAQAEAGALGPIVQTLRAQLQAKPQPPAAGQTVTVQPNGAPPPG